MALTRRVLLHAKDIFVNVVVIATSDAIVPSRWKVLSTYFRLTARRYLRKRGEVRASSVAGYTVSAFNPKSLQVLFTEIFVKTQYFFTSDNPRPLIIDCGSNIGMSILYFRALHPDAEIIGFEPAGPAFRRLTENLQANGLGRVVVHNKAVGDIDGTVDFFSDPNDPGSLLTSTVRQRMPTEPRPLPCVRLSSVIDREVDFLKLDVEGSEVAVLTDLYETGKLTLVKQMVIEYHHHILQDQDALSSVLRMLEECGFGYQVDAGRRPTSGMGHFQDIMLYAYKKPARGVAPGVGDAAMSVAAADADARMARA